MSLNIFHHFVKLLHLESDWNLLSSAKLLTHHHHPLCLFKQQTEKYISVVKVYSFCFPSMSFIILFCLTFINTYANWWH